jgi:hypothetical protein
MELAGIYTIRDTPHPYYWDIVYAWEDELSRVLSIPLIHVGSRYDQIYKPDLMRKILNRLNFYQTKDRVLFQPSRYYLAFHIGPPGVYSFHSRKDVVPIIIDFWKSEDLKQFKSIFSLNKCVFVTSKEVFNYLNGKQLNLKLNLLSLSLPDSMFHSYLQMRKKSNFNNRPFDLIQVGRQNSKLNTYIASLLKEFPEINYVWGKLEQGKMHMHSTRSGYLGIFDTRESFLELLSQSKISLLSAPGMDADAIRTGGFSPVTPRFLESAACGCHLVGMYRQNDDFIHYGIEEVCVNIKDYNDLKNTVLGWLSAKAAPRDYTSFLQKHLTSKRAVQIRQALSLTSLNLLAANF